MFGIEGYLMKTTSIYRGCTFLLCETIIEIGDIHWFSLQNIEFQRDVTTDRYRDVDMIVIFWDRQ